MVERRIERLFISSTALVAQAAGAAVITVVLMQEVVKLGHRIPQTNIAADYLFAMVWALALALLIWLVPFFDRDRADLLVLWSTRVFVVLVVMLFYESHYSLDSYSYFRFGTGSIHLDHLGRAHYGLGSGFMYRLVAAHESLLPASFHATKLSFAIAGMMGVYIFYRATVMFLGHEDRRILLILGLTPSILFWGSILGKDPLAMLGVAIYSYGVVGLLKRRRGVYLVWVVAGVALATAIRVWMVAIMGVPLIVVAAQMMRSPAAKFMLLAGSVLVLISQAGRIAAMFDLFKAATVAELLEGVAARGQGFEGGGSATGAMLTINGPADLVRVVPFGIFSALFRPLPGEVLNPFGMLAGLEDSVVLMLALRAAIRLRLSDLREPMISWALSFLLLWSTLYGFISSHNMGTAVRYRLQVMPLEILLLLYLGRRRSARANATYRSITV
ncbi:MAG: hypothetical protein ACLQU2_35475 [Candidatus Binataceae bacterium]